VLATLVLFNAVAFLVSGIFHEQAHARVGLWLGDSTGRDERRLTWDPGPHIDPIMTILVPIVTLVSSGGRGLFGMMKPVRLNPLNFSNPTLGMLLSGVAGPASNILLATVGLLLLTLLLNVAPSYVWDAETARLTLNGLFLCVFVKMNFLLAGFNLLPLPGLDGGHALYHFLPRGGRAVLDAIGPYSLLISMLIVFNVPGLLGAVFGLYYDLLHACGGRPFAQAVVRLLG
jgi:Zn-dependent protease